MSVKPSLLSNSSATYCGATQIPAIWDSLILVVSGGGSAWAVGTRGASSPAAPAEDSVVRKRRRLWIVCMTNLRFSFMPALDEGRRSALQLALELVEEPPVHGLGNDLVGARFDQARFAQPQREETDCILGVVFTPLIVRDFFQRLERIVVLGGETALDHALRHSHRIACAEVGRLEDGAQRALGRNRIFADEVPVSRQHAAIVLGPWAVDRAVDDHMADLAGAQFLRFRRKAEPRVDLAIGEKGHWRDGWAGDPVDILGRVEPDMRSKRRHEHVRGCAQVRHAHRPALEARDAADAFSRKQLETAYVYTGDDRDLLAGIDRDEKGRREVQSEVDLAARERFRLPDARIGLHIADIGKTLRPQQLLGDVLRRNANAATPGEPDGGCFRRRFLSK